jgi:hypothetical protein
MGRREGRRDGLSACPQKKERGGGSAPPRRFLLDFPIPNYDFDSLCKS